MNIKCIEPLDLLFLYVRTGGGRRCCCRWGGGVSATTRSMRMGQQISIGEFP